MRSRTRRKEDKEGSAPRRGNDSLEDEDELPFIGQPRLRSQSLSAGGLSGISFTPQRANLLPTIHRHGTGASGSLQSPSPNWTSLLIAVAAALVTTVFCIYMMLSSPAPEKPAVPEKHSEIKVAPLYTVADVIMRSWKANTTQAAPLGPTAPRVALCFFGLSRSLKFTLPSIQDNILRPLRESGYRPTVFLHTYEDAALDEQSKGTQADEWRLLDPFESVVTSQEEFLNMHRCFPPFTKPYPCAVGTQLRLCVDLHTLLQFRSCLHMLCLVFSVLITACYITCCTTHLCSCSSEMEQCRKQGTGWVAASPAMQQKNLRNLICQLNSLKEVGQLWQAHFESHADEYAAIAFMRPDVVYRDPFPVNLISRLKVWVSFLQRCSAA
jgi:hypothetical protein